MNCTLSYPVTVPPENSILQSRFKVPLQKMTEADTPCFLHFPNSLAHRQHFTSMRGMHLVAAGLDVDQQKFDRKCLPLVKIKIENVVTWAWLDSECKEEKAEGPSTG